MEGTSTQERQANLPRNALECNICLAPPTIPVATSCGHLFCWPCLYRWLQDQPKPCPVCRTMVRRDINITPIYGSHEEGSKDAGSSGGPEGVIPPRPNPPSPSIAIRPMNITSDQIISMDATADQIINGSFLTVSTLLEINDHNERVRSELHLALEAERAHVNALRRERSHLRASVGDLIRINHQLEARERARRQREERQAFLNSMRVHYARHHLL